MIYALDERIKKLPQWAQRYIAKLRRDINALREVLRTVQEEDTGITWSEMIGTVRPTYYPIPTNARITFDTAGGAKIDVYFSDEGALHLHERSGRPLTLTARSPNTWTIDGAL